jgi:hypothetical protein
MTWSAHEVVLRLRSPLHIGMGQMGNLRRTRPYVPGRVLWGALTMRIARNGAEGPATRSDLYRGVGDAVHRSLAFTYFFPATFEKNENAFPVRWPWEDERAFRYRFMRSFAGTTQNHRGQSAEEGSLREVEFLSPHAADNGEPVFLRGYVFEKNGDVPDWRGALNRLQLGGDRGYGWGDVRLAEPVRERTDGSLFDGAATVRLDRDRPVVELAENGRLLAHARADGLPASGEVEPLVGREWQSDHQNPRYRHAGQHVDFSGIRFAPGGTAKAATEFEIERFGLWRAVGDS